MKTYRFEYAVFDAASAKELLIRINAETVLRHRDNWEVIDILVEGDHAQMKFRKEVEVA